MDFRKAVEVQPTFNAMYLEDIIFNDINTIKARCHSVEYSEDAITLAKKIIDRAFKDMLVTMMSSGTFTKQDYYDCDAFEVFHSKKEDVQPWDQIFIAYSIAEYYIKQVEILIESF